MNSRAKIKSKPLTDRTAKGHSSVTRLSVESVARQCRAAIVKSGIRGAQKVKRVFENIEFAVFFYKGDVATIAQFPRLGQQTAELRNLANRAEQLFEALQCLSESGRRRIVNVRSLTSRGPRGDPLELRHEIGELVRRAKVALQQTPKDDGGRGAADDFSALLFAISLAWNRSNPRKPGVTKSEDNYRGPLVVLVTEILRLEQIRAPVSPQAVAKRLYQLKSRVSQRLEKLRAEALEGDDKDFVPTPLESILRSK